MADTLEVLCSRARVRRVEQNKVPWATVSIELTAVVCKTPCHAGRVLIDRRLVGSLINGEPRSFRVEPGQHTVTVYLGRSARFGGDRKASISCDVLLEPGENAKLVCGRMNETEMKLLQKH